MRRSQSPFGSLAQVAKAQHRFHVAHLSDGGLSLRVGEDPLPEKFPTFADALRFARSISPGELISLTIYDEEGHVKTTAVI